MFNYQNDACYQTILGLVHCLVWADLATFCLIVNHAMNHANPLRVMETDVSSPAFDVIYGMLRCKFELFIISAGLV